MTYHTPALHLFMTWVLRARQRSEAHPFTLNGMKIFTQRTTAHVPHVSLSTPSLTTFDISTGRGTLRSILLKIKIGTANPGIMWNCECQEVFGVGHQPYDSNPCANTVFGLTAERTRGPSAELRSKHTTTLVQDFNSVRTLKCGPSTASRKETRNTQA